MECEYCNGSGLDAGNEICKACKGTGYKPENWATIITMLKEDLRHCRESKQNITIHDNRGSRTQR